MLNWRVGSSCILVSRPVLVKKRAHHVSVVQREGVSLWGWLVKPEVKTDVQFNEVAVMCIGLD